MEKLLSLAPAFVGLFIVLQTGLNRKIATLTSLPAAIFVNSFVVFIISGIYLVVMRAQKDLFFSGPWWSYWLPGLFGFLIVSGGAWSVGRAGAVQTFILIVSAQLITSVVWDLRAEGLSMSYQKLFGLLLVLVGAMLTIGSPAKQ